MFDASVFRSEESKETFLKFVAKMYDMCEAAQPSPTHQFLKNLYDLRKLTRVYTQNIDCLEDRLGFKSPTKSIPSAIVKLHGSLNDVRCNVCHKVFVAETYHIDMFKEGISPDCVECKTFVDNRKALGKRETPRGNLRPNIVLYNEMHPAGDAISEQVRKDLKKNPEVLIVMGTSLKVHGLKQLVKEFAKLISANENGLVLYINKTPTTSKEWESVFQYQILGNADDISTMLQKQLSNRKQNVDANQHRIEKFFPVVQKIEKKTKKSEDRKETNDENAAPNQTRKGRSTKQTLTVK
jgi:NAD-dependent histone deacetylase SIR2